jgi:outer membrane immunogenic protein
MGLRGIVLAGAACVAMAGAAQAQEPFTWTGFYIGANVGYIWGDVDEPAAFPEIDPEGFFVAGRAGYDHQLDNNIVLGAFVFAPVLFADEDETVGAIEFEAELDWAVTLATRAGYAFGDFLPFVMVGYVFGEGTGRAEGAGVDFDLTETHDGYMVGLGADYRVSPSISVGVSWAYTDLSAERYAFTTPHDIGFEASGVSLKADFRF